MTRQEDLVRSTVGAIAETVRDVPPLRLSPAPAAGQPRRPAPGRRRLRSWLAPVAAAAAVIALAVSLAVIKSLPTTSATDPTGPRPVPAAVPAYYVAPEAACTTCRSTRLVVGDTFTGAKLATFDPPAGRTFGGVSAAADDRTFVADTVSYPFSFASQRATWYLVTIAPGAPVPARLTRLRIPAMPPRTLIGAVALSPSGRELAVTYQFLHGTPTTTVLRVYSVTTGKLLRSWSTSTWLTLGSFAVSPYGQHNNQLSWIDGGQLLSFTVDTDAGDFAHSMPGATVRTLNVAAPGGDLIRDSRAVWSMRPSPGGRPCAEGANFPQLTRDGSTVLCAEGDDYADGGSGHGGAFPLTWLAYLTSRPKAARTLGKLIVSVTGPHPEITTSVQWAGPSGSALIVAWSAESATSSVTRFAVVSHGRLTPLPTPPGILVGAPPDIAW